VSSETLHEAREDLPEEVIDKHRAITSLIEEFDAVDWYDQRAAVTTDEELKAILLHNRDEEMEHAAMVLEWLRRRYPVIDEELRNYLFREGDIVASEAAVTGSDGDGGGGQADSGHTGGSGDGSLGIGSLRGR
jgi:ferritin-like protein